MKTKIKEVYYCDHCKKHGLNKGLMIKHEKMCYSNPDNKRPCFNCNFLDKEITQVYTGYCDSNGDEGTKNVELFYCNKKKVFLYTPQNEIKGNFFDLADEFNEPMPKECDLFKNAKYFDLITNIL